MRKLAWFVLVVLFVVLGVAVACALNDPFKAWLSKGLTNLGGAIWISITTQWSNLAITVGKSGTYFLVYTVGILLTGGILLVALTRVKNSGRLPSVRQKIPTVDSSLGLSSTPSTATLRPTPQTQTVEETVAESKEESDEA